MTTPRPAGPQYTGRQVVVLAPTRARVTQERALSRIAGLASVAHTRDFESQALEVEELGLEVGMEATARVKSTNVHIDRT